MKEIKLLIVALCVAPTGIMLVLENSNSIESFMLEHPELIGWLVIATVIVFSYLFVKYLMRHRMI